MLFAVFLFAALPQSNQSKQNKQQEKKESQSPAQGTPQPTPLFGGKVGARSSQAGKESATLGFNGIDPSGKVNEQVVTASPKATDVAQVRNMDAERPSPAQLTAFIQEGRLNTR